MEDLKERWVGLIDGIYIYNTSIVPYAQIIFIYSTFLR